MSKSKIVIALGAILTVLVVITFAAKERETLAEAKGYAAGRQVEIDAATARMKQRQIEFDAVKRGLEKERDEIKTQKQAIRVINKYLPQTTGQVVEVKREDLPPAIRAELPDSPGYTCMTQDAAIVMGKAAASLELCGKARDKLTVDLADETTKFNGADAKSKKFETAATGGSKWNQLKSHGKWFVGGAVIGGVTVAVLQSKRR